MKTAPEIARSEIRAYLEEKAAQPNGEWLRREPRSTHPAILDACRAFRAAGGTYDDDFEQYVEKVAGDLPAHRYHGHEQRDPITNQLGHECYVAKGIIRDEQARSTVAAARVDGYEPLSESELVDGLFYLVRLGTQYTGQDEPSYAEPRKLKARKNGDSFVWMPPRARTHGYLVREPALVKPA